MPEHTPAAETAPPHGEIKTIGRKGYSVYVCADCAQNINTPRCSARGGAQPSPPTFDSLLADPTQQLDRDGVVWASVVTPPGTTGGETDG